MRREDLTGLMNGGQLALLNQGPAEYRGTRHRINVTHATAA